MNADGHAFLRSTSGMLLIDSFAGLITDSIRLAPYQEKSRTRTGKFVSSLSPASSLQGTVNIYDV